MIKGIYFDTGKATIRKNSFKNLDEAAKVLVDFAELKIEVSRQTDDVGKRDYNLDLSQRRADAVKQYLVGKGVAAERISTRGVGPDEPVADNKTARGRAQNRRIEFKLRTD